MSCSAWWAETALEKHHAEADQRHSKPYRGKILVRGKNIHKEHSGVVVSVLPQNPQALFTEITVEEELLKPFMRINGGRRKKEAVGRMLDLLQLNHLNKSHPYDLSGGEQQRLALGKILLLEPKSCCWMSRQKGSLYQDGFGKNFGRNCRHRASQSLW
ncbi:MAG: ATP-binding cassette domain-containing protein [[Clostridium] leptum]